MGVWKNPWVFLGPIGTHWDDDFLGSSALAADEARFASQFVAVCDDSEIILADHTAECY